MERTTNIFLEIKGLTKKFADITAVDNISLRVYANELMCLLGPSGCGKTTTMRLIAGLEKITSGHIYIKAKCVDGIPSYKRNIGMVFQNYALFPHMNVFQNVAFGLKMRKFNRQVIKEKVKGALELVKLAGFENRMPHQLSGGQQQRVALARAVVMEPEILLLDEPLSNLDAKLRVEMRFELKNLIGDLAITTVYVTHDQEEALAIADKIVVMNEGRIEQIGTPHELYEVPQNKFIANFIGVSNILEGNVISTADDGKIIVLVNGRVEIKGLCEKHNTLTTNDKVNLLVRPEKIQVSSHSIEGYDNSIKGIIRNILYLGNTVRYYIENPSGKTIIAEDQTTGESKKILNIGESVHMYWSSRNCLIFVG